MMIGNRPQYIEGMKVKRLYAWLAIEVPLYRRTEMGWRQFELAAIWPTSLPERGEMMTAERYHGFIWRFYFWIPFETS